MSECILALTLDHPAYGCNRIEAMLMLEGKRVSAITIQKILDDRNLGTRYDRWLALGAGAARPRPRASTLSGGEVDGAKAWWPETVDRHTVATAIAA